MDSICSRKAQSEDSSWILSSGSKAPITCHFALFLTCGSSYARPAAVWEMYLLSDKMRHFPGISPLWNNMHKPSEFAFPTHIQCGHTWLPGLVVVLKLVSANMGRSLPPGVILKEWNQAFIHPLFKNCLQSTTPVTRKQQRKQNKLGLEGLKMFCRVEMKVFLIGCLLFLFLLIHHDNKVHWESSY